MVSSAEEAVEVFRGIHLEGLELFKDPVGDTGEVVLGVALWTPEHGQLVAWRLAWEIAKEATARLGRWPVGHDYTTDDPYSREFYGAGEEVSPRRLIDAASRVSPELAADARSHSLRATYASDWPSWVQTHVALTVDRVGSGPPVAEIAAIATGDILGLERLLSAWEECMRPTAASENLSLIEPQIDEGCSTILLLPTPRCEHTPAYIHYWGAGERDAQTQFLAVLRGWREQYGVEVLSNNGLTMRLRPQRRPTDLTAAFALASQIRSFTLPRASSLRSLARALLGATEWELFDRP